MQNRKDCNEVSFECRKLKFSLLKGPEHCRTHGGKKSKSFEKNKDQPSKKKNTRHPNVSGIKDLQHWKKINSKKENVSETWSCSKVNVK